MIAVFLIALMLASGISGYHGNTDVTGGLSFNDVSSHELAMKEYNVISIRERTEQELSKLLVLLDEEYRLRNMVVAFEDNEDLGQMKLTDAAEKFLNMNNSNSFDAEQVSIAPISNENEEVVGWILSHNEGVEMVNWWVNDEGIISIGVTYNDLYAETEEM
jgi:hypothetical protein